MFSFFEASLANLSIHRVGNKLQDEFYVLSDDQKQFSSLEAEYLMRFFLTPFGKVNDAFNLYHPSGAKNRNVVFSSANKMFNSLLFHEYSKNLAIHLFDVSNHPKIKSGEFYVTYFNGVQYKGDLHDAIGIFKTENKETFLTVQPNASGFDLSFENEGISMQKLDKGCLILNTEVENGFVVLTVDNNSKDAGFWKDEFLQLRVINDDYQKTATLLNQAKEFITNKLDEEFEISKSDKADLLNKSIQYFKEKESFDIDEFSAEVFQNKAAGSSFKNFKSIYDEEFDTLTPDSFNISDAAVKKKAKDFKAIIKLDKNFHIYVHGNKELIEKGFDSDKNMNFYKVYFREEA